MTTQPIFLLAFSNHSDAYLPHIQTERKAIKGALLDAADQNVIQVRDIERTSTKELFYLINRYHNRVALLHYAGHADGQMLQLEETIGTVQAAQAVGIAGLLGTQQQLQLVFLNGCATRGQVAALLDAGVGAVIATSVSIQDKQAQQFAAQFYEALATGSSLKAAYLKAKAFLETQEQAPTMLAPEESRGLASRQANKPLPWGLYWRAEAAAVLDWTLPTEPAFQITVENEGPGGNRSNSAINTQLVVPVLKAIHQSVHVRRLVAEIKRERGAGNPGRKLTDAEMKDAIVRSYLAPISVQLRTLFSRQLSKKLNEDRLRQLVATYRISVQLLCYILLTDLWDQTVKRTQPLDLTDTEAQQLRAFFELNRLAAPGFDYFDLTDALLSIAQRNDINFYLSQINEYRGGWGDRKVFQSAHTHFQQMQTALEGDIPSRLIEPFCLRSEELLGQLLCEWHFLLHYHLAVIKNIEVVQIKNLPPRKYKHALVELDNNYQDLGHRDRWQELPEPTDMESVLLYREHLHQSLNLSPFILDENALTREFNSKIYFFSHTDEEGLCYYWIENETDTLHIRPDNYEYVLRQFARARQDLLNESPKADGRPAADLGDEIDTLL